MNSSSEADKPIRKRIHDINGEIFLIRGNAEIALHLIDNESPIRKNLQEIIARSEAMEAHVSELRKACVPPGE